MSAQLRLSHNELSALLKYVFQGLFGHTQDWGALAQYVVWLETHGCDGVSKLVDAIETNTLQKFDGTISKTDSGMVIDFAGNSILMGLPMLVDLIVVHANDLRTFKIEVSSTLHDQAIVAAVAAIQDRNGIMPIEFSDNSIILNSEHPKPSFDFDTARQFYNQSLRDGVPMDETTYKYLNRIADKTLVEATEESRRGAGE